jgi:hypothetical protein
MQEHEQERICPADAPVCPAVSPFKTVVSHKYYVGGVENMLVDISLEARATQFFKACVLCVCYVCVCLLLLCYICMCVCVCVCIYIYIYI